MDMIILTIPKYNVSDGSISDEKFYVDPLSISEILPRSIAECKGDAEGWNSEIVMSNGNKYHILEDPERVVELIAAR